MAFDYDLFVIGGGSGGVRAARVASALGQSVAIAEASRYGGTCVIRGCVPKKLMVFASTYREAMHDAQAYGWEVSTGDFEWPRFQSQMNAELDRLEGIYRKLLAGAGVEMFDRFAKVKDTHTILLDDGTEKTARIILVATGGYPLRPGLKNDDLGIVSDDVFNLTELPKKLLIVGGGYIACEMACIFAGLGSEVTLYQRGAQVLTGFDEEARGMIAEAMRERGVEVHTGTTIVEMTRADEQVPQAQGGVWVKASTGREMVADQVLFATGRAPASKGIGLEDLGVELSRKGHVVVDEFSKTAVDTIYAIGDVTGRAELTPVAIREGMAFVETVFKDNPTPVDHDLIPTAIFTRPEYGCVGLTEEQAAAQEPCDIYCTSFRPMRGAFIDKADRVLMKLIVSKATDKVLGVHVIADDAGEMIQTIGIAVKMGATKADFDRVCAVHPTIAEELVTMKEPVRST